MKIRRVDLSKKFIKELKKAPINIKNAFRERLELYLSDKYNPILNNHALTGKFTGSRSINVTGDYRAIFRELENGEVIYFDLLGTHSQPYR
jgi:addiction module RelE/StbE family toxin